MNVTQADTLRAMRRRAERVGARLTPRVCPGCGEPFTVGFRRGRLPRYCSRRCQDRGAHLRPCVSCGRACDGSRCLSCYRPPAARPVCACGLPRSRGTRTCLACYLAAAKKRTRTFVCRWCGASFTPRHTGCTTYCSRAHCFAWKRAHRKTRPTPAPVACLQCGADVPQPSPRRRFCSTRCGKRYHGEHRPRPLRVFVCDLCGHRVSVKHAHRFCSKACRDEAIKRRRFFPDWPRDQPIPAPLLEARRLYGRALWLLQDADRLQAHRAEFTEARI